MNNFKIITDSTTDLSMEMVKDLDLHIIPLSYMVNDDQYINTIDENAMPSKEFYDLLRGGAMSKTSQINSESFKDHVRPFVEQGMDILYICFSSALSSTFQSVTMGANELLEEFPEAKITIVDSLCASMGEGLLVYHAAKLKNEGKSMDEIATWLENNKLKLAHWFTVDDLNFLKRGGRVSSAAAFFGTVLNVKPILHVNDLGQLVPVEKVRGRRNSLDNLLKHMESTVTCPENQTIFISHGDSLADAEYLANKIKETLNVKEVCINAIGPVIGSHSGPGTIALFFLGENRN